MPYKPAIRLQPCKIFLRLSSLISVRARLKTRGRPSLTGRKCSLKATAARNSVPDMPDYRRWFIPGGTYVFTVVSADRSPFLCEPAARDCLRLAIHKCRRRWPFTNVAFVLLPDHLHALWSLPDGDANYSRRWAWIKREFSRTWLASAAVHQAGHLWQRRRTVWQPRFWEHTIRDEQDFNNHLDYIHFNPVKHGHTNDPSEWPHSSLHRFIKLGWYAADWGTQLDDSRLRDVRAMVKTVGE